MVKNSLLPYQMLLQHTKILKEKLEYVEKEVGGRFNIFSILGMERLECQTHSAFIFELLNPRGSHGQKDIYLKDFVNHTLDLKDFDFQNIKVEREWSIGEWGRIDLVIENKESLIIIENKIDAGDQPEQLKRYWEFAKRSKKKFEIYYLTLEGREPSEESLGYSEIEVNCLSYQDDILNWLKRIIGVGKTPILPSVRETILQYIKLIEKLTGQVGNNMNTELKELLLQNNNLELMHQLEQALPYAKAEIEYKFWARFYDTIHQQLLKMNIEYEYDPDMFDHKNKENTIENIVRIRAVKKSSFNFWYKIGKRNKKELYLVIGEAGDEDSICMSIRMLCGEVEIPLDRKIISAIESVGFARNWGNIKYLYLKEKIDFSNEMDLVTLKEEGAFKRIITNIQKEVMEITKNLLKQKEIIAYRSRD